MGRSRNSKPRLPLDIWPEVAAKVVPSSSATFTMASVFSLIENPEETLADLIEYRRHIASPNIRRITVDYRKCEKLDLCASVLLDLLTIRGKRQRSFRHGKLGISGHFSGRPEIDIMLVSSGILKHLGAAQKLSPELLKRLKVSDLRQGRPSPPDVTSDTELAASDLAEFFDECLKAEKHQLKPIWKSNLIQLITEVLDNAEEHGSGEKVWYTIGYYNKLKGEENGGECHIVIFNFGESIYQSMNRSDTSPELKRQINELAAEHRDRGFFASLREGKWELTPIWDQESLWTLYALQEGVSRFRNRPEGIDRGNGTVKMIEFFSDLASGHPQMALLSGSTHILFDGTYRISPVNVESETRKVIAFNASNDLRNRPDPRYVQTLPNRFPGTLVSLRFQLKQADLANVKEKLDVEYQRD